MGDDPNEGYVEVEYENTKVEKTKALEKKQEKPTLEEIEEYGLRERFKSKIKYFLGDDFNEDEEYQEENLISEEKINDNHIKIEFAKRAYSTLFQYIFESLGDFDFDRPEDSQLFIDYGIPEMAIYKFLFLHQMARSSADFPNVMDISILMYKLKKIGLEIDSERLKDIINDSFETLKKVKYTLASFVYIPLQEVLAKIVDDLSLFYKQQFIAFSEELEVDYFINFESNIPENIAIELKSRIDSNDSIVDTNTREIKILELKLKIPNQKNSKEINETITKLKIEIDSAINEKNILSFKITKYIYVYVFLNSNLKIIDFNKNIPIDKMKRFLDFFGIDCNNNKIKKIIEGKISLTKFKEESSYKKENIKLSQDTVEIKVKSSINEINKIPQIKQIQFFKGIRNQSFEQTSNIYWFSQKKLINLKS